MPCVSGIKWLYTFNVTVESLCPIYLLTVCMPGENITIYEKRKSVGGCCDAFENAMGYVCPGERELEPFMECLWYLCSKIPSLDDPSVSVLDESVRANKDTPIHSECRILRNRGQIYEEIHDYRLSPELLLKIIACYNIFDKCE